MMKLNKVARFRLDKFKNAKGIETDSEAVSKLLSAWGIKELLLYGKSDGEDF